MASYYARVGKRARQQDPFQKDREAAWRNSSAGKWTMYRHSAKKRGLAWELERSEAELMFRDACHYCGIAANPTNGIDRIDNDKGYIPGNIVTACSMCNYAKGVHAINEFKMWVERVYTHQKKQ